MFEDNNWYGHRFILLKYLGLKDRNIYAQIQHGWYGKIFEGFGKKKIFFPPTLVWSRKYKNKNSYKNTIQIGSPFLYLHKMMEKKNFPEPYGTCLFPSHGHSKGDFKIYKKKKLNISKIKMNFDYKFLVEQTQNKFQPPYTVCFHESDFEDKENVNYFKNKGWNVVSVVKRSDKKSLFNLYNLIKKQKNCIFTDFTSSSLLYAMFLKKNVRVIKNLKTEVLETKKFEKANGNMFRKYQISNISYEIAKKELGYKYLKSPEELKKIISIDNPFKFITAKIIGLYRENKFN